MYLELLAPCTWHEYPGCYGFHTLTLCNLYLRLMGRKKIFTSFDIGMSTIWQYYNNIIQILIQNDKSLFCLWTNTHKQCHPGWSDKPVWSRRSYRVYTSAPTQELTNLYLYSTHYSYLLYLCSCDWVEQTVSVFVICIFRHFKHTFSLNLHKNLVFSRLEHRSSPTCICIQPTNNIFCISVFVIDTDQAKQIHLCF